MMCESQKLSKG